MREHRPGPAAEETSVAAVTHRHRYRPRSQRIPIRVPPAHRIRLSPPRCYYYSLVSPSVDVCVCRSFVTVVFSSVPTFEPLSVFYFGKCVLVNRVCISIIYPHSDRQFATVFSVVLCVFRWPPQFVVSHIFDILKENGISSSKEPHAINKWTLARRLCRHRSIIVTTVVTTLGRWSIRSKNIFTLH